MITSGQLANPPLAEVICEFGFDPTGAWDWTIPGRLYERIKEEFPRREQIGKSRYPFWAYEDEGTVSAGGVVGDRVRLSSEDGITAVNISPHQMFINRLYPYPGWAGLSRLVLGVFEKYLEVASPTLLSQAGLRYINQISLPLEAEIDIGAFITLDPPIPPKLSRPLVDFYQRYELPYDDPRGVLLHQTGLEVDADEPRQYLTLDLDFVSLQNPGLGASDIGRWLDAAHDRIEEAFLASVAPELLDKMKGEER